MKKKRLIFFIGALYGGGGERVLVDLLRHLNRDKYELNLVVSTKNGVLFDQVPSDINVIIRYTQDSKRLNLYRRAFGLSKIIKELNADIVISFLTGANRTLMRSKLFLPKNLKIILREGNNPLHIHSMFSSWFWRKIAIQEVKNLYPLADRIVTPSVGIAKDFQKYWGISSDLFHRIHNPVDISMINQKSSEDISLPWGEVEKVKWILAVGRLTKQKGFSDLISSFYEVRKKADSRLIILGEGDLRVKLQNKIDEMGMSDFIFMPGFVKNPWKYMKRADLYISSSLWEGFHLTIAEAMACGTVPIATNCNYGPSEIITDGKDGRLVPVGDVETLSNTICELLENNELRSEMAANALTRSHDFDIKRIIKEYENLFDSFIT